jgi:hypothetical protein
MGNFQLDLQYGALAEEKFALLVGGQSRCHDKRYDVEAWGIKYEIKSDRLVSQTGNIVIEFESRRNPSGVMTTEADVWVYEINGDFWLISVKNLKNLIKNEKYDRIVHGGDNNTSKMYLFNWNNIKNEFKCVLGVAF